MYVCLRPTARGWRIGFNSNLGKIRRGNSQGVRGGGLPRLFGPSMHTRLPYQSIGKP